MSRDGVIVYKGKVYPANPENSESAPAQPRPRNNMLCECCGRPYHDAESPELGGYIAGLCADCARGFPW